MGRAFQQHAQDCVKSQSFRISNKPFCDYLVNRTLHTLHHTTQNRKPVQFHTGSGDNDINLLHLNPAYLQPLIEEYSNVSFVLLHSAYPYTREAGYLAMAFDNVYLDVGEVFPMLSQDGQASVVRQALELVPYSKLLWSTDGHFFPESFWLANKQFREVLAQVS